MYPPYRIENLVLEVKTHGLTELSALDAFLDYRRQNGKLDTLCLLLWLESHSQHLRKYSVRIHERY
jgi:hypothetical protein